MYFLWIRNCFNKVPLCYNFYNVYTAVLLHLRQHMRCLTVTSSTNVHVQYLIVTFSQTCALPLCYIFDSVYSGSLLHLRQQGQCNIVISPTTCTVARCYMYGNLYSGSFSEWVYYLGRHKGTVHHHQKQYKMFWHLRQHVQCHFVRSSITCLKSDTSSTTYTAPLCCIVDNIYSAFCLLQQLRASSLQLRQYAQYLFVTPSTKHTVFVTSLRTFSVPHCYIFDSLYIGSLLHLRQHVSCLIVISWTTWTMTRCRNGCITKSNTDALFMWTINTSFLHITTQKESKVGGSACDHNPKNVTKRVFIRNSLPSCLKL